MRPLPRGIAVIVPDKTRFIRGACGPVVNLRHFIRVNLEDKLYD
jgi:hypothetical protein